MNEGKSGERAAWRATNKINYVFPLDLIARREERNEYPLLQAPFTRGAPPSNYSIIECNYANHQIEVPYWYLFVTCLTMIFRVLIYVIEFTILGYRRINAFLIRLHICLASIEGTSRFSGGEKNLSLPQSHTTYLPKIWVYILYICTCS